jgi:hypothetical protein
VNQGFYLTLLMGSFNASPVPEAVVDSLTSVEVKTAVGSQGGFQLAFTTGKNSAFAQLQATGFFDPRRRVVIAVTVNGIPEVLMDGIITKQDYTPNSAAGKSTFNVTGVDLSAMMDLMDLTGVPYPAMPEHVRVKLILKKYKPLGITATVLPTPMVSTPNPTKKSPKQQGTDYGYIQQLCSATGAVFFLDPGPVPGRSVAYWGPEPSKTGGSPQPALSINLDASTNVESLTFAYDGTGASSYLLTIIDEDVKVPIPVPLPSLDVLRSAQAGRIPPVMKLAQLTPLSRKNPVEAGLAALGALRQNAGVVTGSGDVDVLRYGHVLKVRKLCAIRGASAYYDGLYYVNSVTHTIKHGEYKQHVEFARGGTGSSVTKVAV